MTATVYDTTGRRLVGPGPTGPTMSCAQALAGAATTDRSGRLIVATPITGRSDDEIVGALLFVESRAEATGRIARAWAVMAGAALIALGLAWLLARTIARRLSRPVQQLAAMAADIGDGRVVDAPPPELDRRARRPRRDAGGVVARRPRGRRPGTALQRRRLAPAAHPADPSCASRSSKPAASAATSVDTIDASLHDVARIEATVDHLLAFAREAVPSGERTDLVAVTDNSAQRWASTAGAAGRTIEFCITTINLPVRASTAAVDQVLDVLIDNALRYGAGPITVGARMISGGAAIDVTDSGTATLDDTVFERGTGNGHGIGLSLARSIVEAEGGRLVLTRRSPPTFSVMLLIET